MDTLLIAAASFIGFIIAYHTYGRWLGRKIFGLDPQRETPADEFNDGSDYVPSRRSVVFGHHFTSIAGTGPIVGPAIAVFWGWLPALLWVVIGSIFIGAVHDFGALVVSLRNKGQSIGEIAGRVIAPRARLLLLLVLLLELTIVLAVFGLVIAVIFSVYPHSVAAVWVSLPIAILIGFWARQGGRSMLLPALLAVAVIYLTIWIGRAYLPLEIMNLPGLNTSDSPYANGVVAWSVLLFIYCFIASVLPVWILLQPRDYVNSQQLFVVMALLIVGVAVGALAGGAHITDAPAIASDVPADAPPIWPFLFITIACGAVSGFHSMVSSGTSSKQIAHEPDARLVGYGSMLTEGALAVMVVLACTAGIGMGLYEHSEPDSATGTFDLVPSLHETGEHITGKPAWRNYYRLSVPEADGKVAGGWGAMKLRGKVEAFVNGGANFLRVLGIPLCFARMMLAVMVACFAATTLDTATRLQRYVVQEIGATVRLGPLQNKYVATGIAVASGLAVAIFAGKTPGAGGMVLWPLFGATNQVLAGLGFLVIGFYLIRRGRPVWFLAAPALLMLVLPAWAMLWQMFNPATGWLHHRQWLLFGFGIAVQGLVLWLIVEAALAWRSARREGLLPAEKPDAATDAA
ncbi:MAG: carbon starvation protein A [Planctomycetes bacterium]|jgi:carbon starvation protein|nr:carbon starvation protein A [Phycisphaerae bacterium]NBB95403.1 carbon starvation protein A [Planctomycetota bacterium]